jgi:hypothetical protein
MAFNQTPACGKVSISLWQRPDTMQMLGQKNESVNSERMPFYDFSECLAEQFNIIRSAEYPIAIVGNNCKKISPAVYICSAVSHLG